MSRHVGWRVEFDAKAARALRKLGLNARNRILDFLESRFAKVDDPRSIGSALRATLLACGNIASEITG